MTRQDDSRLSVGGSATRAPDRRWIISKPADLALVLLTPALALAFFAPFRQFGATAPLIAFALVLSIGHYLPGMMRAYGDRALFRRFRTRLLVVPALLLAVSITFTALDLHVVILLMNLWGGWHWMMQVYGFGRVYDSKVGSFARTTARLDLAFCVVWFVAVVAVISGDGSSYLRAFYLSGGPLLSPGLVHGFRVGWLALAIAVTVVYIIHVGLMYRRGQPPSSLKLLQLGIAFPFLAYTVSIIEVPLLGYVMFEACHDIQYLAIVWAFNRNRAEKDENAGSFLRYLFRRRRVLVLLYVGLCLGFGSISLGRSSHNEVIAKAAVMVIAALAMLHYYLDGFIWKIREDTTRASLGVSETTAKQLEPRGAGTAVSPGLRHSLLWVPVLAALLVLGARERGGHAADLVDIERSVVAAFPEHAPSRARLCGVLIDTALTEEALEAGRKSVELRPGWAEAHYRLGSALAASNRNEEAEREYLRAIELDPGHAVAELQLGLFYLRGGKNDAARKRFERAIALDDTLTAAHHNLALIFSGSGQTDRAELHLKRAIETSPDHGESHKSLGVLYAKQGKLAQASQHLLRALELQPESAEVQVNLGNLSVMQGNEALARRYYQRAVELDPAMKNAVPRY